MNRPPLTLNSIDIIQFLGCQRGISEIHISESELNPGLNLIYGPNGSGKSTLAKAILTQLWPSPSLESITASTWRLNGQIALPPKLPEEWKSRYYLALHELLLEDDRHLVQRIRDEIHGGVDPFDAKVQLTFERKLPSLNTKEIQNVKKIDETVRELTFEHQKLQKEEKNLKDLYLQESALSDRLETLKRKELVLKYRKIANEKKQYALQLESFDPLIAHLEDSDSRKLKEYEEAIADYDKQLEALFQKLNSKEKEAAAIPIEQIPTNETEFELNQRIAHLRELHTLIASLEEQLAAVKAKEQAALQLIHPAISENELLSIDLTGHETLQEWQKLVIDLEAESKIHLLLEQFGKRFLLETQNNQTDYSDTLTDFIFWFQKPDRPIGKWPAAGISLALISTLLFFGFELYQTESLESHLFLVGASLSLLAFISFFLFTIHRLFKMCHPHPFKKSPREEKGAAFRQEVVRMQRIAFLNEVRSFLRSNIERSEASLKPIQEALNKDFLDFPVPLEKNFYSIPNLIEKIKIWRTVRLERIALEGKVGQRKMEYQTQFSNCERLFSHFDLSQIHDYHGLIAGFHHYQSLVAQSKELYAEKERLTQAINLLKKERNFQFERKINLLKKVNPNLTALTPNAIDAAQDRFYLFCNQKKDYDTIFENFRRASHQLLVFGSSFEISDEEEKRPIEELQGEIDLQPQLENERLALRETITRISTRVEDAKHKHDLTDRLAEKTRFYADLQMRYEETCRSSIGSLLIDFLVDRSAKCASHVLKRARELFGRITRHKYELLLDSEQNPSFCAKETATGKIQSLHTLSSGTRVQLLLSVRMAFIEEQEGTQPKLPILLDEVLGNSDDERVEAIIDAILTFVKDGRQVFYFTAQTDEIRRWKSGDRQIPHLIHLPTTVQIEPEIWKEAKEKELSIPAPNGKSYIEYGEVLAVSPELTKPLQTVHLWHFLNDPDLLYRFLSLGYCQWGQVRSLVNLSGEAVFHSLGISDDPLLWKKMEAIASVIEKGWELSDCGKGKPVASYDLLNSGCISEQFLQKMIELNGQVNGSASLLLEELEKKTIPGYRKGKIDALRDYFLECAFLDPRPSLSNERIKLELDTYIALKGYLKEGHLTPEKLSLISNQIILS